MDGLLHHLLLLKTLANVVAIEAQVAVLAEAEQNLRQQAAHGHRNKREHDQQVRAVREKLGQPVGR